MAKKNSPADAAVQAAENETSGKKRHRSKRDVSYYAVPAGTKVETVIQPGAEWNETQALEQLKKAVGKDCIIYGPFYKVKGNNTDTDTISVKVSLRDLKITSKQFEGTYAGWKYFANGVKKVTINGEQFADNDLLQVDFEELVDEENKTPKPRFARNMLIRRASLEDCQEVA